LKLALGVVAAIALSGTAALTFMHQPAIRNQVFAQTMALLFLATIFGWPFAAVLQFEVPSMLRAGQAVIKLIFIVPLLRLFLSPLVVPALDVAALLAVSFVSSLILCQRVEGLTSRGLYTALFTKRAYRGAIMALGTATTRVSIATVGAAISLYICIPISALFLEKSQVGVLTAAFTLSIALYSAFLLVTQIFYPILSRGLKDGSGSAADLAATLIVWTAITSTLVYALTFLFADRIVLLVFGEAFERSSQCLKALAAATIPISLGSVYGYAMLAAERDEAYSRIVISGSAAFAATGFLAFSFFRTPFAAFVLLPLYSGQTLAMALYCHRHGLVAGSFFSSRRISWPTVKGLLGQR
jgi:O-antigen/teichoic acid export membrane protein